MHVLFSFSRSYLGVGTYLFFWIFNDFLKKNLKKFGQNSDLAFNVSSPIKVHKGRRAFYTFKE